MSTIITITRALSARSALASALVRAGLVEDRKVLVAEVASQEALREAARLRGEQTPRTRKVQGVNPVALFIAIMAVENSLQVEDIVLYLEELVFEEREQRKAAFMQTLNERKERMQRKLLSIVKRAQKVLKKFVASVAGDEIINKGYIALLVKKVLVAEARLAEVSC